MVCRTPQFLDCQISGWSIYCFGHGWCFDHDRNPYFAAAMRILENLVTESQRPIQNTKVSCGKTQSMTLLQTLQRYLSQNLLPACVES